MIKSIDKSKWKMVSFGDVVIPVKDRVNREDTGLQYYLGGEHFDSGEIHLKRKGLIRENPIGPAFHMRFQPRHMLLVSRNPHLRKASMANFEGICASTTYVCEAIKECLLPEFLPFIMQSDAFWYSAELNKRGSTNPYLNWGDFAKFKFKLPSLPDQRQFAGLLWSIDGAIEAYLKILICTEQLKQVLEWDFFKKNNGKVKRIENVAQVDYGISESVADNKDSKIGWPIITGANISLEGEIDLSKKVYIAPPKKDQFILKKDDLLLNWRSGSPFHVGKTALFDLDGDYTYASFVLRIRADKELLIPKYGFYLFNFLRRTEYFTKDVAQQVNFKMNANVFRSVEVPVPALKVQSKIVNKLDAIVQQKRFLGHLISSAKEIQKGIVTQIFESIREENL